MENNNELALIMKGGGIKGLAYVGALEELTKHYNFTWYVGTSAGAISAILLACGYNHEELKTILQEKDFRDFKDAGFIKKFYNLFTKSGLYEANTFTIWLDQLLAKKLDSPTRVRLESLPKRTTIYASRREEEALIYDSSEPAAKTKFASYTARCSMSIPFIFTPQSSEGLKAFDGGAQNNYPVNQLLKDNPGTEFIGLYLGPEHFEGHKKKSVFFELISIWSESSDATALRKYKDQTVIIDPRPISTLKFSLSDEEKEFLLECGRIGALKFLAKNNKIVLDDLEFEQRKKKLENKREVLNSKVRKKKRIKKIVLWTITALLAFTVYWNWDAIFPPAITNFKAKFEIKDPQNNNAVIENGEINIKVGGNNYTGAINSNGVAVIENIPIEFVGSVVDELTITNTNPNLNYLPIDVERDYKIDRYFKDFKTLIQVYLKGSDTLYGKIIDNATGFPLDSVKVVFEEIVTYSNPEGIYGFKIPQEQIPKAEEHIIVTYTKDGYEDLTTSIIMPRLLKKDILLIKL